MSNKDIKQSTRKRRVKKLIEGNKFLRDDKHYKHMEVSVAAYDSWAAQGKAGGCRICPAGNYHYTFRHKRYTTKVGWNGKQEHSKYYFNDFYNLCSKCFKEVERQVDYKFNRV